MFFEVIPTEVFRQNGGSLTYSSDLPLQPGHLVLIPLGKKTIPGLVLRRVKSVNFPTKPVAKLLSSLPVPAHILKSILWLAKYYLTPLPSAANLFLPAGIMTRNSLKLLSMPPDSHSKAFSTKSAKEQLSQPNSSKSPLKSPQNANYLKLPLIDLNPAQRNALRALQNAPGSTRLLRGVTGSGKTNIYLQMTANALQAQKSVILLVPEIALTSQLIKIFRATFGDRVQLIHSQQTPAERRSIWINLLQATTKPTHDPALSVSEPLILIGPRSALLAPIANLGLIIIDEAHESTYYQENAPRYSSLRLASFIAQTLKIPCIQGTATPNLVDFHLAKTRHTLVELPFKAKATAIDPEISLVDLRKRENFTKNRYISDQLLTKISENIQLKHQTLIFHNRRGSAPITLCEQCGWQALCPNCYLPLALHSDSYELSCHVCGHLAKVPTSCPSCHHTSVIHKGIGTKLLESELKTLFPKAKIARFDGDNKRGEDLATLYQSVKSGEQNILIGTQTLARGLDLPHLATVGIIQADAGLALPDFATEERTFELLTQVIGRVGRGHLASASVILQTYQPDHPVIQASLTADFARFAQYSLRQRQRGHLPPFTYLAKLKITYKTEKTTLKKIQQVYQTLSTDPKLSLSPPAPAFHERTNRGYTWQIIIKSTSRQHLLDALQPFSNFHIEIDPPSLL